MTTFSFLCGVGVAVVAPQFVVPGFVALEAYRLSADVKPQSLVVVAPPWLQEIESGFEYAIGYYIGNAVMSNLFGAQ
jgi:hypothetical protein